METKLEQLIADIDRVFSAPKLLGLKPQEKPVFSVIKHIGSHVTMVEFQLRFKDKMVVGDIYQCDTEITDEQIKSDLYQRFYNYLLIIMISKTLQDEPK